MYMSQAILGISYFLIKSNSGKVHNSTTYNFLLFFSKSINTILKYQYFFNIYVVYKGGDK